MMIYRLAGSALCFSIALSIAAPIHADPAAQAKSMIQAEYNSQNAAMARKDGTGALAYLAPDFCGTNLAGQQIGLAERREGVPRMLAITKSNIMATRIQQFAVKSRVATAQVVTRMNLTIQDPRSGKLVSGIAEYVSRDVWVYNGQVWLLERSQELEKRRLR